MLQDIYHLKLEQEINQLSGYKTQIRGANASYSKSVPNGGATTIITFSSVTNYGGDTYISNGGDNINPVQKGLYSIRVIGTKSGPTQGTISGISVEGGISIYNGIHDEQGTNRYHSDGNWYTSLNIVKYFTAGDTFQIRAHNWSGSSVTFTGTIEFRLICEYP
jgi:hypothetical protein